MIFYLYKFSFQSVHKLMLCKIITKKTEHQEHLG